MREIGALQGRPQSLRGSQPAPTQRSTRKRGSRKRASRKRPRGERAHLLRLQGELIGELKRLNLEAEKMRELEARRTFVSARVTNP